MHVISITLLTLATIFHGASALAEDVPDYTIHHEYESARALGMGNAYTAVAEDFSAIFYNPAGLAFLPEGNLNMFIQGMADSKILKFSSDLKDASGSNDVTGIANLIQQNYGSQYSSRIPSTGMIYARPYWGFAVIPVDVTLEVQLHQTVGPAVSVIGTQDTAIAYGHAWDLYKGKDRFTMGVTARSIYRIYYNKDFLALDLALNSNLLQSTDAQEGLNIDGDVGFMYKFWDPGSGFWHAFRPTLAFDVENVSGGNFTVADYHLINKAGSPPPPPDQTRFNVGTAFDLPDWWVFKSKLAIDERDIGYSEWTLKKGSHIGAEFNWKIKSWFQGGWRVGLNQGYWTAGFSGLFAIFKLDLATYGEEVGSSASSQQSRRYMARASLDF